LEIDIERIFGAVRREVSAREHEGRTARVARVARIYETDVDDLWDALTNRERIPRWFLPVSGDLRLGGRYQLEGNAGGTITACEPPRYLAATWEYGDEVSWITVALTSTGDRQTQLALEHVAYVDDDRWEQYGPGAVDVGWDLALMGLDLHLATGSAVDQSAVGAWMESEAARQFISDCSEDWGRASIAAGTPHGEALAAASRTTAFYTGVGDGSGEEPSSP
jgi:uncharacterized protein YndB with AHSA1/START domain